MGRILIGTCSWTDPTLLRTDFYPKEADNAERRLQYYSSQFPLVEVDSSFYALPSEAVARLWCERTPPDFTFDVKAFALFTQHAAEVASLPKDIRAEITATAAVKQRVYAKDLPEPLMDEIWQRYEAALLPLDSAGKLGVVLFQFPEWFYPRRDAFDYILRCQERLPQYRLAIEFRNSAWLSDWRGEQTLRFLRENHLIYVSVDEPQGFRSSVPPIAEATADLAVVRFHGRNTRNWEAKGITAAERFDYLYKEEELREWLPRIEELSAQTQGVHILFNNCYGDKAIRGAQQMRSMLQSRLPADLSG